MDAVQLLTRQGKTKRIGQISSREYHFKDYMDLLDHWGGLANPFG